MFLLTSNDVYSDEIAKNMSVSTAYMANLRSFLDKEYGFSGAINKGKHAFINKKYRNLPENVKHAIANTNLTDMSDKLPAQYAKVELGISEDVLIKSGIIVDKILIVKKPFYVFNQDFVGKAKNKMVYVLDEHETIICKSKNQIDGYQKLSNGKYITWY